MGEFSLPNLTDRSPKFGIFSVPPDLEANGSLTLAARETALYLWSESPLEICAGSTITGILDDLTSVSLIGCNVTSEGHIGKWDRIRYKCFLSPRCVVLGSRYISHDENVVHDISFVLEHAVSLFHDTDAYGTIFNNAEAVGMVAKFDNPESSTFTGDSSWVSYYTGKKTVFASDTEIGHVSASHSPIFTIGNAHDHGLVKGTEICIRFDPPLSVMEALFRMGRVLQFFSIVTGYSQNVSTINVHTGFDDPSETLELYAPGYAEKHSTREESETILRTSILIHPVENSTEFASVLSAWLERERDDEWRTARIRLAQDWGGRIYSYDRIIAAANVFDLLPKDAYGTVAPLSSDLCASIEASKKIFLGLPGSEERNDVLGYFGELGGWKLKKKINFRAKTICESIGKILPELETTIREAVNLRNHYVHGTRSRIRIDQRIHLLPFLTNSLEFIFSASDLMDAGWNIVDWHRKANPVSHPFHDYLVSYQEDLSRLKSTLE